MGLWPANPPHKDFLPIEKSNSSCRRSLLLVGSSVNTCVKSFTHQDKPVPPLSYHPPLSLHVKVVCMLRCILDINYRCVRTPVWLRAPVVLRVVETGAWTTARAAGKVLLQRSARASLFKQFSWQPQPCQYYVNSTLLVSAYICTPPFREEYFCNKTLFTEMWTKWFKNNA